MATKRRKNILQGIKIVANKKIGSSVTKPLVKLSGLSSKTGRGNRRVRRKTAVKKSPLKIQA